MSSTFKNCTNLTSITIPDIVTSIGDEAFYNSGLIIVNIPDNVTDIGNSAFRGCTNLASVTIGSGVTSIGSSAFENCSYLTSVTFKSTINADSFPPTAFIGGLRDKYLAQGMGTYNRSGDGTLYSPYTWIKQ